MTARLFTSAVCTLGLAAALECHASTLGLAVQEDMRAPQPWRTLTASEQTQFDLGHAVFNTQWSPATDSASRTAGLGPVFNVPSCDACHNSRRRGRGPRDAGEAPLDLVIQLGRLLPDGTVERGTTEYGHVLNPSAIRGFSPEASIAIRYDEQVRLLADGNSVTLRNPEYRLSNLSGPTLPANTVVMPRMPPSLFGIGLLERVRMEGRAIGRFGWQATAPTVAMQTAIAFAREMGLASTLVTRDDCGEADPACGRAPNGGTPEVDPGLFEALVFFQSLHAVPVAAMPSQDDPGERLFGRVGCTQCHAPSLPVETEAGPAAIRPFTDLLPHDLGEGLADRDLAGKPVRSEWRTAPLWGINAAARSSQPLRLLHDGRARSVEEAILWHAGAATTTRERFERLTAPERRALAAWIERL